MKNKIINILLVEDNAASAEIVRQVFEPLHKKYRLTIVETIGLARKLLTESPPDIVIADRVLPDGDAIELLPGSLEKAVVPFIIINSSSDEQAAVRVMKNGALEYFTKSEETLANMPRIVERSLREWANIVERRQAEKSLRELEAKQRTMISNISDVIGIIGTDGLMKYNSPNIEKWFGWQPKDLIGKDAWITVHPDDQERIQKEFYRILEKDSLSTTVEFLYTCKDGSYKPVELTAANLSNNPSIAGVLLNYRDITRRKQAERVLKAKSEELEAANVGLQKKEESLLSEKIFAEALLECLPGYLYVYDDQGNLVRWNKKHETMTGYSAEELSHKNLSDWFEGEDAVRVAAAVEEVFAKGYGEVEANLLIKGGEKLFIHSNGVALTIDGKTYFVGVGIDISERKQAEKVLLDLEEKQRTMISNISDVIGIIGIDGLMKYKSPNIEKWFGWQPQDLIGKEAWITVHPDYLERIQKEFYRILERDNASTTLEFLYKCKDGNYKPVELTATNLRNNSSIAGVLLNYRDISERKQAQEEQEKLQTQLTQVQKMESVGRLAGGVAHDFNNMLGVIIGYSDIILEKLDSSQPLYAEMQEISNAAQRSAALTQQLLAFARKQTVAPQVIDLNGTVEGMLQMIRRLIGEDINLAWRPGKNIYPVNIDPSQIDQILANLCVNARDAITDGGKITIETRNAVIDESFCMVHQGFTPGEFLLLAVSDNGCGMDKETQNSIFEPFFTTKAIGKGTGLGLAMIYGIVKQNNGFIHVYSEPDQGTTFNIYLPRYRGKIGQIREKAGKTPILRGQETILLVEDEPTIMDMTTLMLENLGYTVIGAGTPGEAISLCRKYSDRIKLLLTDVVMPEMNGRDLSKILLSSYPNLKCLFMSGYTADVIAHHGMLDKGVDIIQKPFSMKNLGEKVHEILEK